MTAIRKNSSKMLELKEPLVSVEWLQNNLEASNLVVLDATIPKITGGNSAINNIQIPTTRFFDLKNKFSDVSAPFPTTFPSAELFAKSARELGLNSDSAIVIYDENGIYSSPRAWWMFKAFGHDNVAVLDGGFPAWIKKKYEVEKKKAYSGKRGDFKVNYHPERMKFFEDVQKESRNGQSLIVDARSEARFKGLAPEPRAGLRSGKIPNSVNLPFEDLLTDAHFKTKNEIQNIFKKIAKQDEPLTFSCGSGLTACVLALGAEMAGYKNLSVYDGSWTEWGSLVSE